MLSSFPHIVIVVFLKKKSSTRVVFKSNGFNVKTQASKSGMNQTCKNTSVLWGTDRKRSQSQGVFCPISDIG